MADFTTYTLSNSQLKGIANLCYQEQGTIKGASAEASIMCNLFEKQKKYTDLYDYVRNGGWFARSAYWMDNGSSSGAVVEAVKDVIINGNRTLPTYVDEHDCFSDIKSISTGDVYDRDAYIKDVTVIKNVYGSTYTFYEFPDSYSDPFGYTTKVNKPATSPAISISSLINTAENEIGYLEKDTNSNLDSKTSNAGYNNFTKYWRDIKPEWNGSAWCACFVSWCFMQTFGLNVAQKLLKHWPFVYCPTLAAMTTNKSPSVGSIILFYMGQEYGHTGIVTKVTSTTIETIEGNTSQGSSVIANGGGVQRKTYIRSNMNPNNKFFVPDYSIVTSILSNDSVDFFSSVTNLKKGTIGTEVLLLQQNLNKLGYNLEEDGDFGNLTHKAVTDFQEKHNLEVDGIVGLETRKCIQTAIQQAGEKSKNEDTVKVITNRVKVPIRESASIHGSIIERIPNKNTVLCPTGDTVTANNGKIWYEVALDDGRIGWVHEMNITFAKEEKKMGNVKQK